MFFYCELSCFISCVKIDKNNTSHVPGLSQEVHCASLRNSKAHTFYFQKFKCPYTKNLRSSLKIRVCVVWVWGISLNLFDQASDSLSGTKNVVTIVLNPTGMIESPKNYTQLQT